LLGGYFFVSYTFTAEKALLMNVTFESLLFFYFSQRNFDMNVKPELFVIYCAFFQVIDILKKSELKYVEKKFFSSFVYFRLESFDNAKNVASQLS